MAEKLTEETLPGDFSLEHKEELPDVVTCKAMLLGTTTVAEWEEGGHQFRVDQIEPKQVGASMRRYQLFAGGVPASGGQWHATIEDARERAGYIAQGSMANKIRYLESRLWEHKRQRQDDLLAMEIAMDYIEEAQEPKPHARDAMLDVLRGRIEGKLSWPTP